MPLRYEVSGRPEDATSVDFLCRTDHGKELCIEMRLVQQRQSTTDLFEAQLRESEYFGTTLDGEGDRAETVRLQRLILEKAVGKSGDLTKFQPVDAGRYNIVAVEVSELHLGMCDSGDCLLAAYGDPAVSELERRNLFGLFQQPRPEYPAHIQEVASLFAPFREAIHAILFLRKSPRMSPIDYRLEYIFVHNPQIMAGAEVDDIAREFNGAMEVWKSVRPTPEE